MKAILSLLEWFGGLMLAVLDLGFNTAALLWRRVTRQARRERRWNQVEDVHEENERWNG
jgi:predicted amidophosphoribosyltransferase